MLIAIVEFQYQLTVRNLPLDFSQRADMIVRMNNPERAWRATLRCSIPRLG